MRSVNKQFINGVLGWLMFISTLLTAGTLMYAIAKSHIPLCINSSLLLVINCILFMLCLAFTELWIYKSVLLLGTIPITVLHSMFVLEWKFDLFIPFIFVLIANSNILLYMTGYIICKYRESDDRLVDQITGDLRITAADLTRPSISDESNDRILYNETKGAL